MYEKIKTCVICFLFVLVGILCVLCGRFKQECDTTRREFEIRLRETERESAEWHRHYEEYERRINECKDRLGRISESTDNLDGILRQSYAIVCDIIRILYEDSEKRDGLEDSGDKRNNYNSDISDNRADNNIFAE